MNPDGGDATRVAELPKRVIGSYGNPFWSPASSQLVFREIEQKQFRVSYQIHRMAAEGGDIVELTGDLDKSMSKLILGWRPN